MALSILTRPQFQDTLHEVTRRIIGIANPQRIILFGSGAKGAMTSDSDLDMLVIVRGPIHRRHLAQKIQHNLHGVALPVDIVVVTEEDVQNSMLGGFSIIQPALRDGELVYDAK